MREAADALRLLDPTGDGLVTALGLTPRPTAPRVSGGRAELAALVGRRRELDALLAAMRAPGLVLVHGPPGVGKTHLARAAAARFGEATCVDLGGVDTVTAVVQALASALGVPAATGGARAQVLQLARALASRGDRVLVLDDVEQAPLQSVVPTLLAHAERLRLVVTSREVLGLGERVFALEVLAPDDAVALLEARALERGRDVHGDPGLVELARQLDCLPLALELAAGRLGVLDVADLLERLGLSLLRSGRADAGRAASLEHAIAASWDALDAAEQRWLAELTVFEAGFTMEAAEAVVSDTPWVLDVIARLQRRSVISVVDGRGAVLRPIREFVADRQPVTNAVAVRHGRFFADASRAAQAYGPRRHLARRALHPELANLRAAVRGGVGRGDLDVAVACLAGAWDVLATTGPTSLGAELLADLGDAVCTGRHEVERLLVVGGVRSRTGGDPDPPYRGARDLADAKGLTELAVRARALLGGVADITADFDAAEEQYVEALALIPPDRREARAMMVGNLATAYLGRRQLDAAHAAFTRSLASMADLDNRLMMLGNLGNIAVAQGRPDDAIADYDRALELCAVVGNQRQSTIWLGNLATAHRAAGRTDLAEDNYRRALDVLRSVGDLRTEGLVISNLSTLMQADGRLDEARVLMERALAVHREVGAQRSVGITLANLAMLLKGEGRRTEARELLSEALAIQEHVGDRQRVAVVRASLAQLDVEDGDVAGGLAVLEAIVPGLERTYHAAWLHGLGLLAEARALAGDRDGAREALARVAAETSGRSGAARVSVLAVDARIRHVLGDHAVARDALERAEQEASAIGLHPASSAARELARAQAAITDRAP